MNTIKKETISNETDTTIRLSKVMKELNVGLETIAEFLAKKGFQINPLPNTKITEKMYMLLVKEFQGDKSIKELAQGIDKIPFKGPKVSVEMDNDIVAKRNNLQISEPNNETRTKKVINISLKQLLFERNQISLKYDSSLFILQENGISQILNSEKSIKNLTIKIVLDYSSKTFQFKDVSMLTAMKELSKRLDYDEQNKKNKMQKQKEKMLKKQKEKEEKQRIKLLNKEKHNKTQKKDKNNNIGQSVTEEPKRTHTTKTILLGANCIRFYDGYYIIITTQPVEDSENQKISLRVDDKDSRYILNLVHKYFEQRFEHMHITVKLNKNKTIEPTQTDLFRLSNYIRELNNKLNETGEWWNEVQNYRKPSLQQCKSISSEVVKGKLRLKNGYLDNLVNMQCDKNLISVYEVNHGKEEDSFIFTADMSHDRYAVIFENAFADASTATWVFVTKHENYDNCVNLVFDYFTDYTISNKRSSLRNINTNPPEKFKAEYYTFVDHNDIGQWLTKLNRILENNIRPADITFKPGLNIPQNSENRTGHGETIITKNKHNLLMHKLYDKLCAEYGKENVGTEIRVETKRIDVVVKGNNSFDIYEVKTAEKPFDCVTEALGQLCQYAYLYCRDRIGKMVVVGEPQTTKEVEEYLAMFRKNHSLELYYLKV